MTSKIKVDNINKVSDDSNIIKKCGTTTTIGSGASNPIVVDGSAVTIGRCGGTVALASGATQTGFGRTGTVDWQTSSIKTATFTAANGEGYFCNTAGGSFEVDLPAGSAGAIVSIQDYNNTFDSNSLTVDPNGSEKINGGTAGAVVTLTTEGQGVTFVYIDATVGWRSVQDNQFSQAGVAPSFVAASVSGACNTLTTAPDCGNFKVATFLGPGTFTVSNAGNASGSNSVEYLVIAGGASGGGNHGGGGGAGGYRTATGLPVSAQAYSITVGGGGAAVGGSTQGNNGSNSTGVGITSAGGGGGAWSCGATGRAGNAGGNGGGGSEDTGGTGGAGNTPATPVSQGNPGGDGDGESGTTAVAGGGGGGIAAAGADGSASGETGGAGGNGTPSNITGSTVARGGGGGGRGNTTPGSDSTGGGGRGAGGPSGNSATAGDANKGGGGGGGHPSPGPSGAGGSGIVVIRYKFQ